MITASDTQPPKKRFSVSERIECLQRMHVEPKLGNFNSCERLLKTIGEKVTIQLQEQAAGEVSGTMNSTSIMIK